MYQTNVQNKTKTRKVAINDVLSLTAARRDTIPNLKCLGDPGPEVQAT